MSEKAQKLEDSSYTTLELGVWRLLLPRESFSGEFKFSWIRGFSLSWRNWTGRTSFLPYTWRFVKEIYTLNPGLVLLAFMLRLGNAFEGTLMLYASSRLLRTVSHIVGRGLPG